MTIIGVIATVAWLMQARQPDTATPPPAPPVAAPAEPAAPPVPPPPPRLTRGDLIDQANLYAAAYAAGETPGRTGESLVGRTFQLMIPFGCEGLQAADPAAQATVNFDAARRVIRLSARPADWTSLPQFAGVPAAGDVEHVEGFWLPRPWLRTEACPPRSSPVQVATPTPAASPTLGLAQVFDAGGSRVQRRDGRAYEVTRPAPEGQPALLTRSYRLVLEGRIVGFADGAPIHCWAESPNHRPICIYSVAFDRIAIRDGADDQVLSEWRE